jgi:hypothetical protein
MTQPHALNSRPDPITAHRDDARSPRLGLLGELVLNYRQAMSTIGGIAHTPEPGDPAAQLLRIEALGRAEDILVEAESNLAAAGFRDVLDALRDEVSANRAVGTLSTIARRASGHTNALVQMREAMAATPDPARDEHGDWRACELHRGALTHDCSCTPAQGLGDVDSAVEELWQQTSDGRYGDIPDAQVPNYRRAARRIVASYLGVEVPR